MVDWGINKIIIQN